MSNPDNIAPKFTLAEKKEVAMGIAEAVLFSIYGEDNIKRQRPYNIVDRDEIWELSGTLDPNKVGGVFHIGIRKSDGAVLELWHTR